MATSSSGSLKNISGSLGNATALAKNQPYGSNTNVFRRVAYGAQDVQALAGANAGMGRKLEYVFGKATGNAHNIERSTGMLKQLQSIGVFDNAAGRSLVDGHLKAVFYASLF